jgi:hypothetical protein
MRDCYDMLQSFITHFHRVCPLPSHMKQRCIELLSILILCLSWPALAPFEPRPLDAATLTKEANETLNQSRRVPSPWPSITGSKVTTTHGNANITNNNEQTSTTTTTSSTSSATTSSSSSVASSTMGSSTATTSSNSNTGSSAASSSSLTGASTSTSTTIISPTALSRGGVMNIPTASGPTVGEWMDFLSGGPSLTQSEVAMLRALAPPVLPSSSPASSGPTRATPTPPSTTAAVVGGSASQRNAANSRMISHLSDASIPDQASMLLQLLGLLAGASPSSTPLAPPSTPATTTTNSGNISTSSSKGGTPSNNETLEKEQTCQAHPCFPFQHVDLMLSSGWQSCLTTAMSSLAHPNELSTRFSPLHGALATAANRASSGTDDITTTSTNVETKHEKDGKSSDTPSSIETATTTLKGITLTTMTNESGNMNHDEWEHVRGIEFEWLTPLIREFVARHRIETDYSPLYSTYTQRIVELLIASLRYEMAIKLHGVRQKLGLPLLDEVLHDHDDEDDDEEEQNDDEEGNDEEEDGGEGDEGDAPENDDIDTTASSSSVATRNTAPAGADATGYDHDDYDDDNGDGEGDANHYQYASLDDGHANPDHNSDDHSNNENVDSTSTSSSATTATSVAATSTSTTTSTAMPSTSSVVVPSSELKQEPLPSSSLPARVNVLLDVVEDHINVILNVSQPRLPLPLSFSSDSIDSLNLDDIRSARHSNTIATTTSRLPVLEALAQSQSHSFASSSSQASSSTTSMMTTASTNSSASGATATTRLAGNSSGGGGGGSNAPSGQDILDQINEQLSSMANQLASLRHDIDGLPPLLSSSSTSSARAATVSTVTSSATTTTTASSTSSSSAHGGNSSGTVTGNGNTASPLDDLPELEPLSEHTPTPPVEIPLTGSATASSSTGSGNCLVCGEPGHWSSMCPNRDSAGGRASSNAAGSTNTRNSRSSSSSRRRPPASSSSSSRSARRGALVVDAATTALIPTVATATSSSNESKSSVDDNALTTASLSSSNKSIRHEVFQNRYVNNFFTLHSLFVANCNSCLLFVLIQIET